MSNFAKRQFLNDKIDQNTNFAKLPNGFSCLIVNFTVQELKSCKIAQLFCVSVSLVRENLRELR